MVHDIYCMLSLSLSPSLPLPLVYWILFDNVLNHANKSLQNGLKYNSNLISTTGNARVTPEVTRDVCLLARMMAANLYNAQIEDLMFEVKIGHIFILEYCSYISLTRNFIIHAVIYVALQR